jgi:hypothetical protein
MSTRCRRSAPGSIAGPASVPSVLACTARATISSSRGWRATFYVTGVEHSLTSDTASAWETTPWRAVQVAARDALKKADRDG